MECKQPVRVRVTHGSTQSLARYKLDLVGLKVVRWNKGNTVRAGDYIFSMEKETKVINWRQDFSTPKNSISSGASRLC